MANISQINGLLINAATASLATTASYAVTAQSVLGSIASASYASTASFLNTLNQNLTFNGNLTLNGTASIQYLTVQYETASVIYSTGSNQFGDAANDTQTLYGSVRIPTGSLTVTGSTFITGSLTVTNGITGTLQGTASYAGTSSYSTTLGANLKNTGNTLTLAASDGTTLNTYSALTLSSFTGSLQGTASWATNAVSMQGTASWATNAVTASRVFTQTDTTNTSYFLTFVDANNATPTAETLLTATNINVNPAARSLSTQGAITSSTGFLGPIYSSKATSPNDGLHYLAIITASGVDNSNRDIRWASSLFVNPTSGVLSALQVSATVVSASGGITGSLQGTASYASFAGTLLGSVTSASYAGTASMAPNYVLNSATASFIISSQTGSFATTGSNTFKAAQIISGNLTITGSLLIYAGTTPEFQVLAGGIIIGNLTTDIHQITGSLKADSITGSLQGTASFATTASYISPTFISASAAASGFGSGGAGASDFPYTGNARISGSLLVTASSGVTYAIDVAGDIRTQDKYYMGDTTKYFSGTAGNPLYIVTTGNSINFNNGAPGASTTMGRFQSTTGNFTLGGGGTITDNNYKFQIWNTGTNAGTAGAMWVSGSSVFSGSMNVTAGGITGSLFGSASYALTASYALSAPGGSGSPAGSTGYIQYNNAGAFGADADFQLDPVSGSLIISGSYPSLELGTTQKTGTGSNTDIAAFSISTGSVALYTKSIIADKLTLAARDYQYRAYPLQESFLSPRMWCAWNQSGATAGIWVHTVGAGAGTYLAIMPTAGGTALTRLRRSRYSNVVTTTNQVLGQRNSEAMFYRGAVAGEGGYFFYARFGIETYTNGSRLFVGLATATGVISGNPSAFANAAGFASDSGDNGAIFFLTTNATPTATRQVTGMSATAGKAFDAFIYCKPNDTVIHYRIVDLITGAIFESSATATLPTNTTMQTVNVLASNAALTVVNNTQISITRIYAETDYA
jgi:hypothetical protein